MAQGLKKWLVPCALNKLVKSGSKEATGVSMPTARTSSIKGNKPQPSGKVRVGISGWTYAPWRGKFYPPKLPQHRELSHAANILSSIEINGTFYSLHRPESFAKW